MRLWPSRLYECDNSVDFHLMQLLRALITFAASAIAVVIAVVFIRAIPSDTATSESSIALDNWEPKTDLIAKQLAESLTFQTVSSNLGKPGGGEPFEGFIAFLKDTYPLVHEAMIVERVSDYSLLYRWAGEDEDAPGLLLLAHYDVVPVIPGTEPQWRHPPYAGVVEDGRVWGRGASDDKDAVITLLAVAEAMLAEGYVPTRDVFFAFGHDEEIGGPDGAKVMASILEERGERFALVLDEGGGVSEGTRVGIDAPIAHIGPAEKGFMSLDLVVQHEGGHSAVPPKSTAVGIVSQAVTRLERSPFQPNYEYLEEYLTALSPHTPLSARVLSRNVWLFRPYLLQEANEDRLMSALMRTTTAVTMSNAGVKDNVLPIEARVTVNFRILPGETIESVKERVAIVIDDDRVALEPHDGGAQFNPTPQAPTDGPIWDWLSASIHAVGDKDHVVVAPRLLVGGTDARHYSNVSSAVYRFNYFFTHDADAKGVHGTDERLRVDAITDAAKFFRLLIISMDDVLSEVDSEDL